MNLDIIIPEQTVSDLVHLAARNSTVPNQNGSFNQSGLSLIWAIDAKLSNGSAVLLDPPAANQVRVAVNVAGRARVTHASFSLGGVIGGLNLPAPIANALNNVMVNVPGPALPSLPYSANLTIDCQPTGQTTANKVMVHLSIPLGTVTVNVALMGAALAAALDADMQSILQGINLPLNQHIPQNLITAIINAANNAINAGWGAATPLFNAAIQQVIAHLPLFQTTQGLDFPILDRTQVLLRAGQYNSDVIVTETQFTIQISNHQLRAHVDFA